MKDRIIAWIQQKLDQISAFTQTKDQYTAPKNFTQPPADQPPTAAADDGDDVAQDLGRLFAEQPVRRTKPD